MRFWLATLIMLFSLNTLAQAKKKARPKDTLPLSVDVEDLENEDRDRTGERSLRHLIYFPNAGDFFVSLGGSYSDSKNEVLNSAGSRLSKSNSQSTEFNLALQYGLWGPLAISLTTDFGDNQSDYEPVGAIKETTHEKGMGSPSVGIAYRPLRQGTDWPFDLTLAVGYKPKLETSKIATTTADGNRGVTRDTFGISGHLGYVGDFLELDAAVVYLPGGSGEATNATTGYKTTYSSFNSTSLGLAAQLPVTQWLFIDGNITYTLTDARNAFATATNTTTYFDGTNTYTYGGGVKLMIQPEMTSLRLDVSYRTADDYNYRTSAGSSGKLSAMSGMSYGLTLEHIF